MSVKTKMTALADAIRAKTGGSDKLSIDGIIEAVGNITEGGGGDTEAAYAQGKADERREKWERYQQGGERVGYRYSFADYYPEEDYNPIYPMHVQGGDRTFDSTTLRDTKVDIIPRGKVFFLFYNAGLERVHNLVLTDAVTEFDRAFQNARKLKHLKVTGKISVNGFNVQWSDLTRDSLMSIINALSSTTTDLTVTLSLNAVNNAFETETGLADGSTGAEWLELIGSKPNCTITLN